MIDDSSASTDQPCHPHHRRPRYPGRNPRRFEHRYKELNPKNYPEIQDHVRVQGRTPAGTHRPVLLEEVLKSLCPKPGEVVCDCTLGYGGHAEAMIPLIVPNGRYIALDVDEKQLVSARQRLMGLGFALSTHLTNFAGFGKMLHLEKLDGYDIIFADLGVSSMQVDDPRRGFSYKHDGPLDMRMDLRLKMTAADLLRTLSKEQLSEALWELADEEDHEKIARQIVSHRQHRPIQTTDQLVEVIFQAKSLTRADERKRRSPGKRQSHSAAKTFQTLRILVNDELGALKALLRLAPYCLKPGGRVGIISFHSGEDRLVKKSFKEGHRSGIYQEISEEVISPSPDERRMNPRCRPAKLRWARKGSAGKPSP